MIKTVNTPAPIYSTTFTSLNDLQSLIDTLSVSNFYMFNVTQIVAEAVGLPRLYGVIKVSKYTTHNACSMEFEAYNDKMAKYKLNKFNGSWDNSWTKIVQAAE